MGVYGMDGGAITVSQSTLNTADYGVFASENNTGAVAVSNNTFTGQNTGAVVLFYVPDPLVTNNVASGSSTNLAFQVISQSLDLNRLSGNRSSGWLAGFMVSGTLGAKGTWPAGGLPLILIESLDVPVGVTLTIAPGAVVKGDGGGACAQAE